MSDLAKDVAKELDRRRLRRRLIVFAIWLAAVAAALMYVRCGRGSGGGPAAGNGSGTALKRCKLRIDAKGISVDGQPTNRATAVEVCKRAGGAEVVVTGDSPHGDWPALRAALTNAGVNDITEKTQ
jgi:hypothetical protein